MARNTRTDNHQPHDERGRFTSRNRKRDRIVDGVKSRPYTVAAVATAAAGAAAFLLSRKSDRPLMNWGQDDTGAGTSDSAKAADRLETQGSTTMATSLETASTSPSSSAGIGSGKETSPSSVKSSTGSAIGQSSATGVSKTTGSTGLDETAKDQTKTGSVAYGA